MYVKKYLIKYLGLIEKFLKIKVKFNYKKTINNNRLNK